MATLSADTSDGAEALMIAHLRRMTPGERFRRAFELRDAALVMSRARLRRRYPGASERETCLRLASLWLDRDTMRRVFDWDPELHGY
jgi:hypothetical protein